MGNDVSVKIENVVFNFRVACFIENDNHILLSTSKNIDFWNLPGGRVKIGESTLDAIKRELKEELDLTNVEPKLIHIAENMFFWLGNNVHELCFFYKLNLPDSHPLTCVDNLLNLEDLNETFKWFNKNQIKHLKCLPEIIYSLVNKDENISHSIKPLEK